MDAVTDPQFVAYLWGIETRCGFWTPSACWSFVAYLWGIETYMIKMFLKDLYMFVAYLWGIETDVRRYTQVCKPGL